MAQPIFGGNMGVGVGNFPTRQFLGGRRMNRDTTQADQVPSTPAPNTEPMAMASPSQINMATVGQTATASGPNQNRDFDTAAPGAQNTLSTAQVNARLAGSGQTNPVVSIGTSPSSTSPGLIGGQMAVRRA